MIEIKNLYKIYNQGKPNEFTALKDVSLSVPKGQFLAVTGKSGAGKSTFMNITACLDTPTSGHVIIDGTDLSSAGEKQRAEFRKDKLGIVTQAPMLIEELSAIENVKVAFYLLRAKREQRNVSAVNLLKSVGLGDRIGQKVSTLSGGEKQRVSIARALAGNPCVILADEPTGNLDSKNAKTVFRILKNVAEQGITVIMVTHDGELASECDRVVEIADGQIVSDSTK